MSRHDGRGRATVGSGEIAFGTGRASNSIHEGPRTQCIDSDWNQQGTSTHELPHQALPMPSGGGGTDFRPVFAHLEEERIAADVVVYLTDGYGEFGDDPGLPTIWVMTTDQRPPWGEFVQVGVER